jgi:hypothetical protein
MPKIKTDFETDLQKKWGKETVSFSPKKRTRKFWPTDNYLPQPLKNSAPRPQTFPSAEKAGELFR